MMVQRSNAVLTGEITIGKSFSTLSVFSSSGQRRQSRVLQRPRFAARIGGRKLISARRYLMDKKRLARAMYTRMRMCVTVCVYMLRLCALQLQENYQYRAEPEPVIPEVRQLCFRS